jgi:adenosylcobinamide-GDP ribazoletransferase
MWFPVVGAAVGALAGAVRVLCGPTLGATVATVLAMIVLVIATGALHQDGLADTADGLGARGGRARRLEVMRDSSTGVFGALALIAWALLLLTTVASLDGDRALRALTVACMLARWVALLHAAAAPPARIDGLGASLRVGGLALVLATAVSVVAALAICGLAPGAAVIGTSALIAALSAAFARRTLGGRTGDTLGATVAVAEVAVCTVLLAVWHG